MSFSVVVENGPYNFLMNVTKSSFLIQSTNISSIDHSKWTGILDLFIYKDGFIPYIEDMYEQKIQDINPTKLFTMTPEKLYKTIKFMKTFDGDFMDELHSHIFTSYPNLQLSIHHQMYIFINSHNYTVEIDDVIYEKVCEIITC